MVDLNGGESGIRTHGSGVSGTHDFQSCPFGQLGHLSASLAFSHQLSAFNLYPTILTSVHPETRFLDVILRSPANSGTTKNLMVSAAAGILRGACPELSEGLRMTLGSFRMDTNY
jgi:hypothetical protein